MKKLIVIISGFALLITSSCTSKNEGGMSEAAKKNLAASQAISKTFETKDFSKLGDYIADSCIDHAGESDIIGLANMKTEFEKMIVDYDDMKGIAIKELADDEYVMSWMHFTGTSKSDNLGMKAGDMFDMKSIEISKFNKDGKAIEHWSYVDPAEMMKMMSASMAAPPPSAAIEEK